MNTTRTCPQCGAPLSAEAPEGLCPACLMKAGLPTSAAGPTAAPAADPLAPAEIASRFPQLEIIEMLGRGGMGVVYKARQKQLDRVVALKVLPPEVARDPHFAERFLREARALARLNHPNIVTVHEFGESGGLFFLIMEFVDGVNLRQLEGSHRLVPGEALSIIPKICDALQYAHEEGVVHRDIKPENILVDKKGRVKIADFGLAKLAGLAPTDARLTQSNLVMGTPHYMAPEQTERPMQVDHRADIYSLGVVFYEMLTGELPIGRFQPPSAKVQVDVRLDEVVLKSLEKEPERRYQQVSEVKTAVEQVAAKPAAAQPPVARETNQAVRNLLWWPAYAMLLFGPIVAFFGVSDIFRWWVEWTQHQTGLAFFPQEHLAAVVGGILATLGGVAMLRLRWYGLAMAGVVGMVTGAGVGQTPDSVWGIGSLMIAIAVTGTACWAGITLFLPAVRAAFNDQRERDRQAKAGAGVPPVGVPASAGLDAILRQVKGPAMGLLATAIFLWVIVFILTFVGGWLVLFEKHPAGEANLVALAVSVPLVLMITGATLLMVGAQKMKRLESYGWAMTASILAAVGGGIGVPFGIWALVVLLRPEVRAAFGGAQAPGAPPLVPGRSGTNPVKLVLILVGCLVAIPLVLTLVGLGAGLFFGSRRSSALEQRPVTTLKSFTAAEATISKDLVVEDGGWTANCTEPRTIALFEMTNPGVEACTITYRAQLKTEKLKGRAYLEMWCRLPGSGESFSKGFDHVATGSMDWSSYETPFFLKKGEKPDLLRLNLVVEGTGRVGIRNVEVLTNAKHLPAASATPVKLVEKQAIAATDVLRMMGVKYAALSSFTASGQVVSEVTPSGGGAATTVKHTFAINLARPEFYRITWTNPIVPGVTMQGAAWCAGDGHKTMIAGKVGTYLNRKMALAAATGVSGGAAGTVPSLFFKDDANSLSQSLKNPTLLPEETVGAEACYVVAADRVVDKVTLWITKKDWLLKKIQIKIAADSLKGMTLASEKISDEGLRKMLKSLGQDSTPDAVNKMRKLSAESQKRVGSFSTTSTITYETIAVNELMIKEDFEYSIPKENQP